MPIDLQCESNVLFFHVLLPCLFTSGAVRQLQQLLHQPISCFLKLDATVTSQHRPGPFSQHKAMMMSVFPQGSGLRCVLHTYAPYNFVELFILICFLDNVFFNLKNTSCSQFPGSIYKHHVAIIKLYPAHFQKNQCKVEILKCK